MKSLTRLLENTKLVFFAKTPCAAFWVSVFVFARILFAPITLASSSTYHHIIRRICTALPEIRLNAPYGRFAARRGSTDIALLRPCYEPAVAEMLHRHNRGIIIDVGANFGRHSVSLAFQKPLLQIIAIEPEPDNFAALLQNKKLSRTENIIPVQAACTSKTGRMDFYTRGRKAHEQATLSKQKGARIIKVQGMTLDKILAKHKIRASSVNLVKIDAEGAEIEVLKGAESLLKKGRAQVIFEARSKKELEQAKEFLEKSGYSVSRLDAQNFLAEKK